MKKKIQILTLCLLSFNSFVQCDIKSFFEQLTDATRKWTDFNKSNWSTILQKNSPAQATRAPKIVEKVFLDDIVGAKPAVVDDVLDILLNWPERKAQGIGLPNILLYGPPGVAKTRLLLAIAHEAGWNVLVRAASDFEEMWVGLGAARIRELFAEARKNAPCVIIIDEIDALGTRDNVYGSGVQRQLIDALLAEMDGVHSDGDVMVCATTNDVSLVDKALRRPGRFDYVVEIQLPDELSRKEILMLYLSKKPHEESIDLSAIARQSRGFSGAELEEVIKRAMINVIKNKRTSISQQDVDEGFKQLVHERRGRL